MSLYARYDKALSAGKERTHGKADHVGGAHTWALLTNHLKDDEEALSNCIYKATNCRQSVEKMRLLQGEGDLAYEVKTNNSPLDPITDEFLPPAELLMPLDPAFCPKNLIPVGTAGLEHDGSFTVGALSHDSTFFGDASGHGSHEDSTRSVNTFCVTARLNPLFAKDVIDIYTANFINRSHSYGNGGLLRNIVSMLTFAAFQGSYTSFGADTTRLLVRDERPGVATSHIVQLDADGAVENRKYDTVTLAQQKSIPPNKANVGKRILVEGPGKSLAMALFVAHQAHPEAWAALLPEYLPPKTRIDRAKFKGLMRRALSEVPLPKYELHALTAEAAAACGRVYGMADESLAEDLNGVLRKCETDSDGVIVTEQNVTISGADVLVWHAKGVITAEVNMTRLFSLLTKQSQRTEWQRASHYKQLISAGLPIKAVPPSYETYIAALFTTHAYGTVTQGAGAGEYDTATVSPTGHALAEAATDSQAVMRAGIVQTRDALAADTLAATRMRRTYNHATADGTLYAHSLDTSRSEYIPGQGTSEGVYLTNIATGRATAGAIISLMAWLDPAAAALGTHRGVVEVVKGHLCGPESTLTQIATEIKRYGWELRINDDFALGVGNTRKDYGFATTSNRLLAVRVVKTQRKLSKQMDESKFNTNFAHMLEQSRDAVLTFGTHRALTRLVVQPGIVPDPRTWHRTPPTNTYTYGFATFEVHPYYDGSKLPLMVKSSSLSRSIMQRGGFTKRSLTLDSPAATFSDKSGTYTFSGDCALLGMSICPALIDLEFRGHGIPQDQLLKTLRTCYDEAPASLRDHCWGSRECFEAAAKLYADHISEHGKQTVARACWHACTGFIATVGKWFASATPQDEVAPVLAPYQTLLHLSQMPKTIERQAWYTIAVIVGADAGWPNPSVLVHLYSRGEELSHKTGDDKSGLAALRQALMTPQPLRPNKVCSKNKKRRCGTACYAVGGSNHQCHRCKLQYACATCCLVEGLLKNENLTSDSTTRHRRSNVWEDGPAGELPYTAADATHDRLELALYTGGRSASPAYSDTDLRLTLGSDYNRLTQTTVASSTRDDVTQAPVDDEPLSPAGEEAHERSSELSLPAPGIELPLLPTVKDNTDAPDKEALDLMRGFITFNKVLLSRQAKRVPELNALVFKQRDKLIEKGLASAESDGPPLHTTDQLIGSLPPESRTLLCPNSRMITTQGAGPYCKGYKTCRYGRQAWIHNELYMPLHGTIMHHPETRAVTELGLLSKKTSFVGFNGKMYLRNTTKYDCGHEHSTAGDHWCVVTSYEEPGPLTKMGQRNLEAPTRKLVGDRYPSPEIPEPLGEQSAIYHDILAGCGCAGCVQMRTFTNQRWTQVAVVDGPVWHADLAMVRKLGIQVVEGYPELWGDTSFAVTPQCIVSVTCWLATTFGRVFNPGNINKNASTCGVVNIWDQTDEPAGEVEFGKPYYLQDVRRQQRNFRDANYVHAFSCNRQDIVLNYLNRDTPRIAGNTRFIASPGHGEKPLLRAFLRVCFLVMQHTPLDGQTPRDRTTLNFNGAIVGDMNHYQVVVSSGDSGQAPTFTITSVHTCGLDHLQRVAALATSPETEEAMRRAWGEQTTKWIVRG